MVVVVGGVDDAPEGLDDFFYVRFLGGFLRGWIIEIRIGRGYGVIGCWVPCVRLLPVVRCCSARLDVFLGGVD